MLLKARAAPMAIMAQPASPARPQVKRSNSPLVECWSRSLCDSMPVGRRRRRVVGIGASGRNQVSVTAAPIRTTVATPHSLTTSLIYYLLSRVRRSRTLPHIFCRDGRTLPGLITRDAASRFAYYASTQALAATKIAVFERLSAAKAPLSPTLPLKSIGDGTAY